MKRKKILSMFVTILIITIVLLIPVIAADSVIDEKQTGHSKSLQMGLPYVPGVCKPCYSVLQGIILDKNYIDKVEIYFDYAEEGNITAGIAKNFGGIYLFVGYAKHSVEGGKWNTFDFDDITVEKFATYCIMIHNGGGYNDGVRVNVGYEDGNPYTKIMGDTEINPFMSYFDVINAKWIDEQDCDMAFKVWGYNDNDSSSKNTQKSILPSNGQNFLKLHSFLSRLLRSLIEHPLFKNLLALQ